ncbi:hypothetical protein LEP1GSC062_1019 [Leptospira alexanderi serovar Manhao 3 str. L 60]|uniref:Uncharacterized protein n=1 Tax=Leptospira alexanderi serovar Manhao 3 str. L 60 TaxID=1049759 RepID=V6IET0_9LEPT|nr:hypothetical protein LEP1GSC062_1019 [Leptospira alexanderi serovar Manhao 3 str. L 60]
MNPIPSGAFFSKEKIWNHKIRIKKFKNDCKRLESLHILLIGLKSRSFFENQARLHRRCEEIKSMFFENDFL